MFLWFSMSMLFLCFSMSMMMTMEKHEEEDFGDQIPIGFRFVPTDEELVTAYLINKVSRNSIPVSAFQEINATEFYDKPPKRSVHFSSGEREWFFFIHKDGNFDQNKTIRIVGNGLGFWRSNGEKKPVFDAHGNLLAFKIHFIYFSGCLSKSKKTHWRMDEFRLLNQFYRRYDSNEEWVVGRLTRGKDYDFSF